MITKINKEKVLSRILGILGIVIVIDSIFEQFFNISVTQDSLVVGYCVAFILTSLKLPTILKQRLVIIPLYVMMLQMLYSLFITYV